MLHKLSTDSTYLSGNELDALIPDTPTPRSLIDGMEGAAEQGRRAAVANALLNAANKSSETSFFIKYPMLSTAAVSLSSGLLFAGIGGVLGGVAMSNTPGLLKHTGTPAGSVAGGLIGSYVGKNVADWIRARKIKKIKSLLSGASLDPSKINAYGADPVNNTPGAIYDNYTLATKLLLKQKQKRLDSIDDKAVNEVFNPLLKSDRDYSRGVPTYEHIKALDADQKNLLSMLKDS